MIVWLQVKDRITVSNYPDQTSIFITDIPVYLRVKDEEVWITSVSSLHFTSTRISYDQPVSFINRSTDQHGRLIVQKGRIEYHPYIRKDHMVINSSEHSDVTVPVGNGYLHVDGCDVKGVHLHFGIGHNEKLIQECQVQSSDLIAFYPYLIRFEKNFVLIHGKDVHLPLFQTKGGEVAQQEKRNIIDGYQPSIETIMHLQLKEPQRVDISYHTSFSHMLPSIFMAMASVFVAIINSFRSYQQGKEFLDIVPMLLVPAAMLISSIVITPVLSIMEKRRYQKTRRQAVDDFQKNMNNTKEMIDVFVQTYEAQTAFLYETDRMTMQSPHTLYVLFPVCQSTIDIQCEKRWNSPVDEINEMADAFIASIQPVSSVLSLNLKDYASIYVSGNRMYDGMRYLFYCIVCHSHISMAVLVDHHSQNMFWLRFVRNLYENGKRNIFHDSDDLIAYAKTHPHSLCVIMTDQKISVPSTVICMYIRQRPLSFMCDLSIRFDENIVIHDYKDHRQWDMAYDERFEKWIKEDFPLHDETTAPSCRNTDFLTIHGVDRSDALCIAENYAANKASTSLTALIGMDPQGKVIRLNMHEKHDGPHGIVAGMTGSGKSELLLTMVLSLAVRYSPDQVQFAFVDFKGGGLADQLKDLPHTAGVLSNLDQHHFIKALSSFTRICTQRQQLLLMAAKRTGISISNVKAYRNAHDQYPDLPYPAELFILIDEFAELRKTCPQYMKDLISIARIGRSLGIHLILCTQKPSGNINEEILSNCSFRIVLKVADRKDSAELLRHGDASFFTTPGQFILETSSMSVEGQAGYANQRSSEDGIFVDLLDDDGTVIDSSREYVPLCQPQMISIIKEIQRVCKTCAEPLWTSKLTPSMLEKEADDVFGLWDDIVHNKHRKCTIHDGNMLFYCPNRSESQALVRSLVYSSLFMKKDVVISGAHQSVFDCSSAIVCIKEEEIETFMEKLMEIKETGVIWICCDVPYRKNEFVHRKILFDSIVEKAAAGALQMIVITSDVSLLSLSSLHRFDHRFAIGENSRNELLNLFETASSPCSNESGYGLCKADGKIHTWCYRFVSDQLLTETLRNSSHKTSFTIGLPPCRKDRIPIGKGKNDWLYVDSFKQLIIVSSYDNPLYAMEQSFKGLADVQYGYDCEKEGLFLCSSDEAKPYKYTVPILLLDEGSVYGFASNLKIHKGQALLFIERHSEVIQLVNPKQYTSVYPACSAESNV